MTEQIAGFDVEHLHGPEKVSCAEDELVVVCLVRDGLPWVGSFVEHYFSLGAKHLVFLDNGSTDGTVEALGRYDRGVTVLRTEAPFRQNEGNMRRYLIDRFGRGRWCLCVDMDELFDYPHSDVVPLGSLLGYLSAKSYTAVGAVMVDMFPERLSSEREDDPDGAWQEGHRFYDTSGIKKRRLSDADAVFRNNAFDNEGAAVEFRGGIRDDVFRFRGPRKATKYPLLFSDGKVRHFGPHQVRNARVADLTCVLLHYKFYAFSLRGYRQNVLEQKKTKENPHSYERYREVLENAPDVQLRRETSREFSGVNGLLEDGLLFASEDYAGWAEEDETLSRVSPADDPRALVEALVESRRRERAGILRSRRLEQRPLDLDQRVRDRDQKLKKAKRRADLLEAQVESLHASLRAMQESSMWRYTAPLRRLVDGAKRVKKKLQEGGTAS